MKQLIALRAAEEAVRLTPDIPDRVCEGLAPTDQALVMEAYQFNHLKVGLGVAAGSLIYDFVNDGRHISIKDPRKHEYLVAAARLSVISEIVDDRLDKFPISTGQRSRYIAASIETASVANAQRFPEFEDSDDPRFRASMALTRHLQSTYLHRDQGGIIRPAIEEIFAADDRQITESDPHELIGIAKEIGSASLKVGCGLAEIQLGRAPASVRRALCAVGAGAMLLDHLKDADKDLKDGVNTFVTATISSAPDGDSPAVRRQLGAIVDSEIRQLLVDGQQNTDGEPGLNRRQSEIYSVFGMLSTANYSANPLVHVLSNLTS